MSKKLMWTILLILALLIVGCRQQTEEEISNQVKQASAKVRFVYIDLGSVGELYIDTAFKRSWVRFRNTGIPIEVNYIDYFNMKAEVTP